MHLQIAVTSTTVFDDYIHIKKITQHELILIRCIVAFVLWKENITGSTYICLQHTIYYLVYVLCLNGLLPCRSRLFL